MPASAVEVEAISKSHEANIMKFFMMSGEIIEWHSQHRRSSSGRNVIRNLLPVFIHRTEDNQRPQSSCMLTFLPFGIG